MRLTHWRLLVCAVLFAAGCGPVLSTSALMSADEELAQARENGGLLSAPYHYYYARAALKKAREEASEGHYQAATRLAEEALAHARQANPSTVQVQSTQGETVDPLDAIDAIEAQPRSAPESAEPQ